MSEKPLSKIWPYLLCGGTVFSSLTVPGQDTTYYNPAVKETFEHIYNYRLQTAGSNVALHVENKPVWPLLDANVAWWQIISGYKEDQAWNQRFGEQIEATKKLASRVDNKHEKAFFTITVHALQTRYDILKDNYLSALGHLNACIGEITSSFGQEGAYEPFYLTSGLYYYFMANAYEMYPLMRPYLLLYPSGDKEKGLQYLRKAASSDDIFLRNEATYFLMRIHFDLEHDYAKAALYCNNLLSWYPNNLMYRLYYIHIMQKSGNKEQKLRQENLYKVFLHKNVELTTYQKKYFLELLEKEEI